MNRPLTVLVTGATGQQGGGLARLLLARGHRVRALTRKPDGAAAQALAARGAEIVVGHFDDRASIERAARGADTVFIVSTPFEAGVDTETRQGIAAVDAARAAGAGHIVFTSVAGADQKSGIPHFDSKARVEEHLVGLGVPCTIIAPAFFMENLVSPYMWGAALAQGSLPMALSAERPLQQIAVADIAGFAAAVIERREAVYGRRIDIASDEATGTRLVEILSQASGRPIHYTALPPAALRGNPMGDDMAIMFEWFEAVGYHADIAGLRRDWPEVGWHSLGDWAAQQDWAAIFAAKPQG